MTGARAALAEGWRIATDHGMAIVRSWVRGFRQRDLIALIDGRSVRPSKLWDLIDERYRAAAIEIIDTFNGDRSDLSILEIDRRTRIILKQRGFDDVRTPQKKTQEFLAALKHETGRSTRAQRRRKLRKVSGIKHHPSVRPVQVVACDVIRVDNVVLSARDDGSGELKAAVYQWMSFSPLGLSRTAVWDLGTVLKRTGVAK